MGINITDIKNAQLREIAIMADSAGKNPNNILDYDEISIFKKEAKSQGLYNEEAENIYCDIKSQHKADNGYEWSSSLKSIGLGLATQFCALFGVKAVSDKINLFSKGLMPEEIKTVNNTIDKLVAGTKAGNKVKIINVPLVNSKHKIKRSIINEVYMNLAEEGKNAFCKGNKFKSKVVVNREKLPLATFHELGHSYNHYNSGLLKGCHYYEAFAAIPLTAFFALFPAFTKEIKPEDGKELTKTQKFHNDFRKACPALAVLAMVPQIAEEGIASLRGNSWAKRLLSPDLFGRVAKTNAIGFASYALTALGLGFASYVALKAKDKYMENKNGMKHA